MVKTNPVKKEKPKMDKGAIKPKKESYLEGVGRRKTAIARVRLTPQKGKDFSVNKKTLAICFPTADLQKLILSPLELTECSEQFAVSVQVKGGGMNAQAEAIRHGLSRALVLFNPEFRKKLKDEGYLKRDPRMRERKKFGLKRARKAPQWAKR